MTADLCEKFLHFMNWRKICRIFHQSHRSTFQNVHVFFTQICCHFQPRISRLKRKFCNRFHSSALCFQNININFPNHCERIDPCTLTHLQRCPWYCLTTTSKLECIYRREIHGQKGTLFMLQSWIMHQVCTLMVWLHSTGLFSLTDGCILCFRWRHLRINVGTNWICTISSSPDENVSFDLIYLLL